MSKISYAKHKVSKVKVVILGDKAVGKTAFAVRYLTKRFIGEYDSNKEMKYSHKVFVDKEEITLEVLDTFSDQTQETMMENLKWADTCILIYSVAEQQSFVYVKRMHKFITSLIKSVPNSTAAEKTSELSSKTQVPIDLKLPIIIIANKTDLVFSRTVTEAEGSDLSFGLKCPVFELSVAENGQVVMEVMEDVIRQIRRDQTQACGADKSVLTTVKQALKKKIYRSKSDTV